MKYDIGTARNTPALIVSMSLALSLLAVSGCSDSDDGQTRSGGIESANISGDWSGNYVSREVPECSGGMTMRFNSPAANDKQRVTGSYQLMPAASCPVNEFSGLFSGSIAGSAITLDDNDGDQWRLGLGSSESLTGEISRAGATVAQISLRRRG